MTLSTRKIFRTCMTRTTMSLDTLLFMAMFTTGQSFTQCLLLSALVNGMMRGSFIHGSLEMMLTECEGVMGIAAAK
jgi:hypothetical protein